MSRGKKHRSRLCLSLLEMRDVPSTTLVKDINAPAFFDSNPAQFAGNGNTSYFVATDAEHGREIWVTDGTPKGTQLYADVNPGPASSDPTSLISDLGRLFFVADGGNGHGRELWMVDSSGAKELIDINPGAVSSLPGNLTRTSGTVYFTALDPATGVELWKTDGTTTQLVKDIAVGAPGSAPTDLVTLNNKLLFTAADAAGGREVWISDGSDAGTTRLKDINPGAGSASPDGLTLVGNKVYFAANDGVAGKELWVTDGTAGGTVQVKDIAAGATSSTPINLTNLNGTLYFSAFTSSSGRELWKSDGTLFGTVAVADINPGAAGSLPTELTAVGATLFFSANDGTTGRELWKTDGSAAGTVLVKEFRQNLNFPDGNPVQLTNVNGTLYLVPDAFDAQSTLWRSDGTTAGTIPVKDFAFGIDSVQIIGSVGGTVFLSAVDKLSQGRELWAQSSVRRVEKTVIGADAGQLPQLRVFDRETNSVEMNLFAYDPSFRGGVRVAVGDVTGDGVDDVITAAGAGGGPHIKVFDGVTGTVKKEFFAYAPGFAGGVFVAVGDFNKDGFADIVTGAGAGGGPHVKVFNGRNLGMITEFFAFAANFLGGVNVGAGDVNADGHSDLIFAAGPGGGPHVRVISGQDNKTELRSFFAFDANFSGGVNIAAGDLNGDGYEDLIVSQASKGNRIRTFNGRDNVMLKDFAAAKTGFAGGVRVASADNNHDGFADLFSFANDDDKVTIYCRSAGNTNTFVGGVSLNDPAFLGGVFVGA